MLLLWNIAFLSDENKKKEYNKLVERKDLVASEEIHHLVN